MRGMPVPAESAAFELAGCDTCSRAPRVPIGVGGLPPMGGDAVSMQIKQLEQKFSQQLQQGLSRIETLLHSHHAQQLECHDKLQSHPLLDFATQNETSFHGVPITVTIVGAVGIQGSDSVGWSDPYCQCEVLGVTGLNIDGFKTRTCPDTKDPLWNQSHTFESFVFGNILQFSVYDKDQAGSELLGRVKLPHTQILPSGFYGTVILNEGDKNRPQSTMIVKVEVHDAEGIPIPVASAENLDDIMETFNSQKVQKPQEKQKMQTTDVAVAAEAALQQNFLVAHIRALVLSHRFETFSVLVILFNGAFIGYQADWAIQHPGDDLPYTTMFIENLFFFWFWSELLAKFLVGPYNFFKGPDRHWNFFDLFLMVSGTAQNLAGVGGVGASVLRCFRAGRVVKLAPFIKTNPFFKELRLMIYGTFACLRGLLWASVMLVSIMYLFGMVFMGAATTYLKDAESGDKTARLLVKWYGSLPITLRTLFRVISGGADWFDASEGLWRVHVLYGILFTAFIHLMVFGVLNVLVGVFVDSAMATASMDAEILAREAEIERQVLLERATVVLTNIDADGSGTVTWEEFEANLSDPELVEFLDAMNINAQETQDLFDMVDSDGSGHVDINEFMECCMKLKSGANLNTIVTLVYETKAMSGKMQAMLSEGRDASAKIAHMLAEVHEINRLMHCRICPVKDADREQQQIKNGNGNAKS